VLAARAGSPGGSVVFMFSSALIRGALLLALAPRRHLSDKLWVNWQLL